MHRLQRIRRTTRIDRMLRVKKKSLCAVLWSKYRIFAGSILFLLLVFVLVSILGCDSGWSIAGWEIK